MKTTLTPEASAASREALRRANVAFAHAYPGDSSRRQPVHTVYGGAHLFRASGSCAAGGFWGWFEMPRGLPGAHCSGPTRAPGNRCHAAPFRAPPP
ncbi:DUF6986 family protein, partial [Corallococcus exercitus]|uniref:DUF6986 family protein n=1 Tax=Corallococcus exercitus TaxID=2316736 RepID=UPI003F5B4731